MKFSIETRNLQKALALVASVVEKRNIIPMLSQVLIRAEDGRVTLTGTDLEREFTATLDAEIEEPGAATATATIMKSIVDKLPKGGTITISADDRRTVIAHGKARLALEGLAVEDFPEAKPPRNGVTFAIGATEFASILDAAVDCVSTESTRYYLCGVYLHAHPLGLAAVSTDGHRLIRRYMPTPEGAENMPGVIIPTKSVTVALSLLATAEEDVSVTVTPQGVWIEAGRFKLSTKIVDGTYPDYERVIPRQTSPNATFAGAEFSIAVERAAATKTDTDAVSVGMLPTPDGLVLSVGPRGHELATEYVDAEFHAEVKSPVGANSRYLSALAKAWGTDPIDMQLGSPADPILFTSTALPQQLIVLMPLRF